MGKYIVELKKDETLYKAATRESDGVAYVYPAIGTPYTEPDLEQVRKEAYEQGLSDAWECARKVTQVRKYGGYGDCLEEVFGRHRVSWDVFDYSATEAIEKIRQYEQEKETEIKVGDEVRNIQHGWTAVVSAIDRECMTLMDTNGKLGDGYDMNRFIKTGRHFPEIVAVLEKMRGEQDG